MLRAEHDTSVSTTGFVVVASLLVADAALLLMTPAAYGRTYRRARCARLEQHDQQELLTRAAVLDDTEDAGRAAT